MPRDRRKFHAEIGAKLAALRESKGWTQGQAVIQARGRIKMGTLKSIEAGRVKHPDVDDLRVLASTYAVAYADLAQMFFIANYGSDLARHEGDQQSNLSTSVEGGQAHDPATARLELQQLRSRVARYEEAAGKMRAATDDLFKLAVALEEIKPATGAKPSGRRRHHKVG